MANAVDKQRNFIDKPFNRQKNGVCRLYTTALDEIIFLCRRK